MSHSSLQMLQGQTVWLEKGNRLWFGPYGLQLGDHVSQLARRFNVFEQDVPRLVRNIVRDGKAISNTLGERHGRQGYQNLRIREQPCDACRNQNNGFIVTVYLIWSGRNENENHEDHARLPSDPIWISDPNTGQPKTGIETVDGDEKIREISLRVSGDVLLLLRIRFHEQAC